MGPTESAEIGLDDGVESVSENTVDLDEALRAAKKRVTDFLGATDEARRLSERDRDYYDHKQWTAEQVAVLTERQQAPIVVNRIKPKVDGLIGLLQNRQTDPKAYPRTKKHEKSAEAITDALRYIADNNDFQEIKADIANDFFVEGYGACLVCVKPDGKGEPEVIIERIPWDRFLFDPYSRKRDFSDARYMGYVLWMSEEEAKEIFAGMEEEFPIADQEALDETFQDRPAWFDKSNNRVRIAHVYWKKGREWMEEVFVGSGFLIPPRPSAYLDEFDRPTNPIEAISAFIDRDNNRYGEVRAFIHQQDEINHRRSKFLHMNSQRQTAARRGAIEDIEVMKRELAKPNGHVEWEGEAADFQILKTGDMADTQLQLYLDAKSELDAVSFNAQLAGERSSGDLSGRAIEKLQAAGTMELNGLYQAYNGFEKRIYRKEWERVRQYWTGEKWIRVTDDSDSLRWVGLNAPVTAAQWLQEAAMDESRPLQERKAAEASLQFLTETQDPRLEEIVEVSNPVAEMDVDIILEVSLDTISVQEEQFAMLAKFAGGEAGVDIIDLIELSQIRNKDAVIGKIEKRRQEAMAMQGDMAQKESQKMDADIAETTTRASVNQQDAQQKAIESAILINNPYPQVTSVST